jgi:hypothetical protein
LGKLHVFSGLAAIARDRPPGCLTLQLADIQSFNQPTPEAAISRPK